MKTVTCTTTLCILFLDHVLCLKILLEYQSIDVKPATRIDANHVLVVYKKMKDNHVERKIVEGPTVFMPEAEEW